MACWSWLDRLTRHNDRHQPRHSPARAVGCMPDLAAAYATVAYCVLPAPAASPSSGAPTRARRMKLACTTKPVHHEATRRARNAWTARITENAPFTPRT